jgi:hypothetical protein
MRPLTATLVFVLTLWSKAATADRTEWKAVPLEQLDVGQQHFLCVLRTYSSVSTLVPRKGPSAQKVFTHISTDQKESKDLNVDTLTLTITPNAKSRDYRLSVESGVVDAEYSSVDALTGVRLTGDMAPAPHRYSGIAAVLFRPDAGPHLTLSERGEQLDLDFRTGLLLRSISAWNHASVEVYSCS